MLTIPWTSSPIAGDGPTTWQVSRLELTRLRDVPGFLLAALKLRRILLQTSGPVGLSLRAEPSRRTFWTLSQWDDAAALRAFTRNGYHRHVMGPIPGPHGRLALPHLKRERAEVDATDLGRGHAPIRRIHDPVGRTGRRPR